MWPSNYHHSDLSLQFSLFLPPLQPFWSPPVLCYLPPKGLCTVSLHSPECSSRCLCLAPSHSLGFTHISLSEEGFLWLPYLYLQPLLLYSLFLAFFFCPQHLLLFNIIHGLFIYIAYYPYPPLKCKLHEGRKFCHFVTAISPEPRTCVGTHGMHSQILIKWMNKWSLCSLLCARYFT